VGAGIAGVSRLDLYRTADTPSYAIRSAYCRQEVYEKTGLAVDSVGYDSSPRAQTIYDGCMDVRARERLDQEPPATPAPEPAPQVPTE
jgi:hypothetical protein